MREPSHLRAAVGLLVRSLRAGRGVPLPVDGGPRRRPSAERQGIEVDAKRVEAFRRVTGGENARGEAEEGSAPVPPTYPALWETALALELLGRGGFPLPSGGILHVESERFQLRPLLAGDRPRCRLELDGVEPHAQGRLLSLACRSWNGAGQLCQEGTLVLLARTGDPGGRGRGRATPRSEAPGAEADWRELRSWALRSSHGRRYARVSGDFNPIHLWSWSSRPFGFRRPILHGFCLEAMVAHALIEHRMGGDPSALRRLRITFRSPLLLPATVRLQVAARPPGGGFFRVVRDDGGRPLAEGEFGGGTGAGSEPPLPSSG